MQSVTKKFARSVALQIPGHRSCAREAIGWWSAGTVILRPQARSLRLTLGPHHPRPTISSFLNLVVIRRPPTTATVAAPRCGGVRANREHCQPSLIKKRPKESQSQRGSHRPIHSRRSVDEMEVVEVRPSSRTLGRVRLSGHEVSRRTLAATAKLRVRSDERKALASHCLRLQFRPQQRPSA